MNELEIYRRAFAAISQGDLEAAAGATLEAMIELTHADRGFVLSCASVDGPFTVLVKKVARDGSFPDALPSQAIVRSALASRAPVRIENALEQDELKGRPSVRGISVLSVLAVPVVAHDEPVALVYLDSVRVAGIFSRDAEAVAQRLADTVAPALRASRLLRDAEEREARLREQLAERGDAILGRSRELLASLDRALKAAPSEVPILLHGESGTGKELFARAIHRASARATGPFVAINCGALPEATLEAELFGYRKGAFTGAVADRQGRFEAAHGGTLFLDEIGDMPRALQVKLLRALQSGEIQKLGETRERRVDVRVISATHRDLSRLVKKRKFREDLLYRLRVVSVEIPPLRERGDDVVLLARAFADRFGREQKKGGLDLAPSARAAIQAHDWPGNVRELENALRHAAVFATAPRIHAKDLPPELGGRVEKDLEARDVPRDAASLKRAKEDAVAAIERAFVSALLEESEGNVSRAAKRAKMNRTVFHELMARHGIAAREMRRASSR